VCALPLFSCSQDALDDFTRATHKRSQSVHQIAAMYASSAMASLSLSSLKSGKAIAGAAAADSQGKQEQYASVPGEFVVWFIVWLRDLVGLTYPCFYCRFAAVVGIFMFLVFSLGVIPSALPFPAARLPFRADLRFNAFPSQGRRLVPTNAIHASRGTSPD